MRNYLRKSYLLILIFHIPGISHAVVNCKVSPTQPMKDDTVTLTGNITVGEDINRGTKQQYPEAVTAAELGMSARSDINTGTRDVSGVTFIRNVWS
ncbi:hypothetical protein KMW40_20230 [Enterobacter cloacae]|uniref:hypothetical protein n=1 Tax=Enterobacter cloacae TaxID=550 RepID=UPI0034A441D9